LDHNPSTIQNLCLPPKFKFQSTYNPIPNAVMPPRSVRKRIGRTRRVPVVRRNIAAPDECTALRKSLTDAKETERSLRRTIKSQRKKITRLKFTGVFFTKARKPFATLHPHTQRKYKQEWKEALSKGQAMHQMTDEDLQVVLGKLLSELEIEVNAGQVGDRKQKMDMLLRIMDTRSVSMKLMHELLQVLGVYGMSSQLKQRKQFYDAKVREELELVEETDIVYCKPENLVEFIKEHDADALKLAALEWVKRTGGHLMEAPLQLLVQGDGRTFSTYSQVSVLSDPGVGWVG
jgi:hypothetical protein